MPTADKPQIHYRTLAAHLAQLPLSADCGDLAGQLRTFDGAERLAAVVARLPSDTEWLAGARAVAAALHRENHRFDEGLFLEWCCANY